MVQIWIGQVQGRYIRSEVEAVLWKERKWQPELNQTSKCEEPNAEVNPVSFFIGDL